MLITYHQGRSKTVLRPRQASVFMSLLHITLKLALEVVVIFLVNHYSYRFAPV